MKRFYKVCLVVLCCVLFFNEGFAQTPNYQWARSAAGNDDDQNSSCSTDASGNIITTGYFTSDTITFGTTVLINSGRNDLFIVKYDPSGNVLWAKSAGGNDDDYATSCTTDANGNIIVTGYFESDTITFGTAVLTNATWWNSADMFIVKYDSIGNVLWAQSVGGDNDELGMSCCTDASGNIIVAGDFSSDSITFGTTILINNGFDMFIVKYDPNGSVIWAQSVRGYDYDNSFSCCTDANGNIILTGSFSSPLLIFGITVLTNVNNFFDMFIVKYDSSGNVLWAQSAGGTAYDGGSSCSSDASGNIIVTGVFDSPTITFGSTVLTSAGSSDMFIVKYSPNGNILWAKSAGGTNSDWGRSCSTDASGNIIATGNFSPTITFGTTVLTSAGSSDIFIVKYNSSGNVLWATSVGGTSGEMGQSCATDASGNIIISGFFASDTITFGTNNLINTNAGNGDMFIVKLNDAIFTGTNDVANTLYPVSISPNPATTTCTITAPNFINSSLVVYDITGRALLQQGFNGQAIINAGTLQPGMYVVEVKDKEKRVQGKLIKE